MACNADFEDELSAGLKAGVLGLIAGGLLWLVMGEKKHGTKGYEVPAKPRTTTTTTQTTSTPRP